MVKTESESCKAEPRRKQRGGWRVKAGRRRGKVPRRHRTIWVSDEEYEHVQEYLFHNRANDPE